MSGFGSAAKLAAWAGVAPGIYAAEFGRTLDDLVTVFRSSGDELFKVYNATTGEVDGGWQVGRQWQSLPHQIWSATAFLRLVYEGLFGLSFGADGITIRPTVPTPYAGEWSLRSLRCRAAMLDVALRGEGTNVRSVHLDGQATDSRSSRPPPRLGRRRPRQSPWWRFCLIAFGTLAGN
jgi:hypothetical protein